MDPREAGTYHHGDLKRALIEAATAAVDDQGELFSLRRLAQELNVYHPAAYRHFRNRDALIAAVAAEGLSRLATVMERAATGSGDLGELMVRCGEEYVRFGLRHPGLYQVMFSAVAQLSEPSKTEADRVFSIITGVMYRAQIEGRILPGDAEEQARAAWAMVHGLLDLNLRGQFRMTSEEEMLALTRRLLGTFLHGLFERA